jgi:hypothetical protein
MQSLPNKSSAWNSFNKINVNEVQCELCQGKLAYQGSTTTMHNHLRAKNPSTIGGPSTGHQSVASFLVRPRP